MVETMTKENNNITLQLLEDKSNDYKEFKEDQQERFNQFSKDHLIIIYTFSPVEFEKRLYQEYNLKVDDIQELTAGIYYRIEDKELVYNFLEGSADEKSQYMKDANNFYGGLYYELWNHEYYLSADNTAVFDALGIDKEDLINYPGANEVLRIYNKEFERLNV